MALKNQGVTVCYVAWNTSTNAGQTGDAANHTLRLVQDGSEGAPTNGPNQVDSTNAPGVYSLALTESDMNYNCVVLCGRSSTANVVIIPLVLVTERGVLPPVVPGATGGFLTLGSGAGQISVDGAGNASANVVEVNGTAIVPNAPISGFQFYMTIVNTDQPATGIAVTSTVSIDGAGFASTQNTATEISNGWYKIDLTTTDLNGTDIALSFAGTGCNTTLMSILLN